MYAAIDSGPSRRMRLVIRAARLSEPGIPAQGEGAGRFRAPARPDNQADAGEQYRNRQQLSHRRAEDQKAELRIRLAEQLARHSRDGIADQKEAAQHAGMAPNAAAFGEEQDQEQQQPLA